MNQIDYSVVRSRIFLQSGFYDFNHEISKLLDAMIKRVLAEYGEEPAVQQRFDETHRLNSESLIEQEVADAVR
jgi:hypothetical protein